MEWEEKVFVLKRRKVLNEICNSSFSYTYHDLNANSDYSTRSNLQWQLRKIFLWLRNSGPGGVMLVRYINTKQLHSWETKFYQLQVLSRILWSFVDNAIEDVSDAFWLAHIYFHIQSYARAHALLTKPNYLESSYDCRYLAALCLVVWSLRWLKFRLNNQNGKMLWICLTRVSYMLLVLD